MMILVMSLPVPGAALAGDAFSGRVVDLDLTKGLMVVEPFRAGHHMMHGGRGRGRGRGRGHGRGRGYGGVSSMEIVVHMPEGPLPGFVKEGSLVRVSGEFLHGGNEFFRADGFRPFQGRGNDPTGVRQRLGKHCDRACGGNAGTGRGKEPDEK